MEKNITANLMDFFLKEKIEQMAKEYKFVQRKSPISGINFLLAFTTGAIQIKDLTLNELTTFINNATTINVSYQALNKRISQKAVDFIKKCFEYAISIMSSKIEINNELIKRFTHIFISDSTSFQLDSKLSDEFKGINGSASSSLMKIQYTFDYISAKLYIKIGDSRNSDAPSLENIVQNNLLKTSSKALFLQDLGYLKGKTFSKIDDDDNFFISKVKKNISLLNLNDKKIDLIKYIKHKTFIKTQVKFNNKIYNLCGIKLDEKVANEKIRKAQKNAKSRGKTLNKEMKTFLRWNMLITNLGDEYDFKTLQTLYRLRWQIELHFKAWKSILKIHTVKNIKNKNRILCEIYGKLIIAFLIYDFNNLIKSYFKIDISYYKILKFFSVISILWSIHIFTSKTKNMEFLKNINLQIQRQCKKNKQKNKLSIDILLEQLEVSNDHKSLG
jgi:hypothetical protein